MLQVFLHVYFLFTDVYFLLSEVIFATYLIPFPQEPHYWLSAPAAFNSDRVPLVLRKAIDRKMTRILSSHLGLRRAACCI